MADDIEGPVEPVKERRRMSDTESSVLIEIGEMKGMLRSALDRMTSIESEHKHEISRVDERLNNHGDRLHELEQFRATHTGEQNGKRMTMGIVITLVVMAVGFASWFIANGLSLLQAGAGRAG